MARDAVGEVRERTDIIDVVSQYLQLKKTGRSFKGLCPFHHEKTPSFVVFPDSQNFHCFGCGKGGDVFTFYKEIEHTEFREALAELAKRAGIQLAAIPATAPEVDAHRQRLIDLSELAATYFANILLNSQSGAAGRELAEQRGLDEQAIAKFQLGFAPDSWDGLLGYLSARGLDTEMAAEAGLLQPRDTGGYYDRFRNRFMFPIRNRDGRVVGFGGRALGDGQPKYLNSPQTSIFDKSSLLFGLDLAKDEIRRRDQVVIVEGYMDAIAAHQFGYENVVAAMGTAVTESQTSLVKRLTKHIVLALDADAAGQLATIRGLETMQAVLDRETVPVADAAGIVRFEQKLNAEISIVQLPEGKDPDELLRKSADDWPVIVAKARPFLDFYIESVAGQISASDARGKAEAVSRIAPVLRQVADRVVQAHYARTLSRLLQLDERVIVTEIRRSGLRQQPQSVASSAGTPPERVRAEDYLIALLLKHRAICTDLLDLVPEEDLMDSRNRELLTILRDDSIPDLESEQILAGLDDQIADHGERLLALLGDKPAELPGRIRIEVRQALDSLGKERYGYLMRQLQSSIQVAQQEQDQSTIDELTSQIAAVAERHQRFYPPPSPYFRDSRDTLSRSTGR
ncbi:MAG: DNA primase [Thermomicrobiales bacterium]